MSTANKEIMQQVFDLLGKGSTSYLEKHLADNATWNIVGQPVLSGKDTIVKIMQQGLESEKLAKLVKMVSEGDEVRVESINESQNGQYIAYYCEIYRLKNGLIEEITCYRVSAPLGKA